jgi:TRAP-type mannitol/chloroaromatic compound transport system permease large subunit
MGLIALPSMLRNGYDRKLAAGTVVTAGTLGQIIPPSTMLIILSEVMSTPTSRPSTPGPVHHQTISVGQVFAAALLPGLMLVGSISSMSWRAPCCRPGAAPALRAEEAGQVGVVNVVRMLVPPIVLIVAVLGSILGGLATPPKRPRSGPSAPYLLAGFRLSEGRSSVFLGLVRRGADRRHRARHRHHAQAPARRRRRRRAGPCGRSPSVLCALAAAGVAIAVWRLKRAGVLRDIALRTMTISAMIFGTIIGASVFSLVFRGLGGDGHIEALITAMPGGPDGALLFVMALIFVVGFFLDFVEISVIILPIVAPALILLGLDPIWLAVLIAINLQTSFLTPPFGFSLFYLRGAAPPEITTIDIYRGVAPYIGLQIVGLVLVWSLPAIATTLPRALFG